MTPKKLKPLQLVVPPRPQCETCGVPFHEIDICTECGYVSEAERLAMMSLDYEVIRVPPSKHRAAVPIGFGFHELDNLWQPKTINVTTIMPVLPLVILTVGECIVTDLLAGTERCILRHSTDRPNFYRVECHEAYTEFLLTVHGTGECCVAAIGHATKPRQ